MIQPKQDLSKMTDAELVEVIHTYGMTAPWYGDEDERTPQTELFERRPYLKALDRARSEAWTADQQAAGALVTLDAPVSAATERLRALYDEVLTAALAGMASEPTLEAASSVYRMTRRAHERAKVKLQVIVRREAESGTYETSLADAAGVDRMTIRSWLGKR